MANSQSASQTSTNYKEAFSLYDKRGNGRVSLDSLGDLLRACGQNPTLAEIADLEKTAGGDCTYNSSLPYKHATYNHKFRSLNSNQIVRYQSSSTDISLES